MMGQGDSRFLRALKRGDSEAFARFVDLFGPRVHALCRRYTRCEADAEDLTQEIFVGLAQSVERFRGDASLSTYVYRAAMNHCLKHVQRRKPESQPLGDFDRIDERAPSPEREAERGELRTRIDAALTTLSPDHRDAVILHELHGLTYAECAAALSIPVGTVKSRLFHAFKNLRASLGELAEGAL